MMQQSAFMIPSPSEGELKLFRHLIRKHVGISFSRQKTATLKRKLASRLTCLGLGSYSEYYRFLVNNKEGGWELRQLINFITVERTAFFRHPKQFELLSDIALPQVMRRKAAAKKIRLWSAGCSTGQEVYSIAMVVDELFDRDPSWDIKILATDIDTDALKMAYKGQYAKGFIQQIPRQYVKKYFKKTVTKERELYSVKRTLREKILFRRLNFMEPVYAFRSPVDILFCRNVMIYFDPRVRKGLIDNFFDVLEPEGFLFLGSSESLVGRDDRFSLIGHSTYQKVC